MTGAHGYYRIEAFFAYGHKQKVRTNEKREVRGRVDNNHIVTCRGKRLSLLFDVVVLLLITTGTPHSHIRACGPSAITHGMLSHMRSG